VCADHLSQFRASRAPFVKAADKSAPAPAPAPKRGRRPASRPSARPAPNGDREAVRAWARSNGYEVGARGRISSAIKEAYAAAESAQSPTPAAAPEPEVVEIVEVVEVVEAVEPAAEVEVEAPPTRRTRSGPATKKAAPAKATSRGPRGRKASAKKAAASKDPATPGATNDIRSWAHANGFQVGERGRIPAHVREAYEASLA
jgi:hypothetical protein